MFHLKSAAFVVLCQVLSRSISHFMSIVFVVSFQVPLCSFCHFKYVVFVIGISDKELLFDEISRNENDITKLHEILVSFGVSHLSKREVHRQGKKYGLKMIRRLEDRHTDGEGLCLSLGEDAEYNDCTT